VLTLFLCLITVLSWFMVVSNAGGFAQIAMIMYVPGYLVVYGLMYWFMRPQIRTASRVVLPLFAVLVITTIFFLEPIWTFMQRLGLVGKAW
jgi:hypothetical protein